MLGERHYRSCLNLKGSLSRVSMSLVSVFIGKSCNHRHHVLPPLCKPFSARLHFSLRSSLSTALALVNSPPKFIALPCGSIVAANQIGKRNTIFLNSSCFWYLSLHTLEGNSLWLSAVMRFATDEGCYQVLYESLNRSYAGHTEY